jgi:hypothetical protein
MMSQIDDININILMTSQIDDVTKEDNDVVRVK